MIFSKSTMFFIIMMVIVRKVTPMVTFTGKKHFLVAKGLNYPSPSINIFLSFTPSISISYKFISIPLSPSTHTFNLSLHPLPSSMLYMVPAYPSPPPPPPAAEMIYDNCSYVSSWSDLSCLETIRSSHTHTHLLYIHNAAFSWNEVVNRPYLIGLIFSI